MTNLVNGKIFIGKVYKGLDSADTDAGILYREAVKKYGKENFIKEILEYIPDDTDIVGS